jgi:hypothetical protein
MKLIKPCVKKKGDAEIAGKTLHTISPAERTVNQ